MVFTAPTPSSRPRRMEARSLAFSTMPLSRYCRTTWTSGGNGFTGLIVRCSPGIPFSKNDHFLPGICALRSCGVEIRCGPALRHDVARLPHPKRACVMAPFLDSIGRLDARGCDGRHIGLWSRKTRLGRVKSELEKRQQMRGQTRNDY